MGLIKAVVGSVGGTLSETWKDYFVCDSMDSNTLMVKGTKRGGSGSGEIITNGSGIVVNEGQILEVAAEPGNFTFTTEKSPSIFDGGLTGIVDTFKEMLGRFTYGGEVNKNQRVYYINTKEIFGNLFGTAQPIPFRIIDKNINLDVEFPIRCNGEYSFRISNPLVFYSKIAGNTSGAFTKDAIESQMKSEMLMSLQPAFAKIAEAGVRYSEVPAHVNELAQALNDTLATKWGENRGISLATISINSVSMDEENEKKLRDLQLAAVNKDVNMAAANLTQATADAIRDAANNENGAMNGFVGMNMANGIGGNAATQLFQQAKQTSGGYCPQCGKPVGAEDMFCSSCGHKLK